MDVLGTVFGISSSREWEAGAGTAALSRIPKESVVRGT